MKNGITIITEEIDKFMNEATNIVNDNKLHFKQQLNTSSFYNYQSFTNDYDVDIPQSDISINWSLSFWVNQMGVEKVIIDVENVNGVFSLEYFDKISTEMKQESQKNIQEYQWKFNIGDASLAKGGTLYVTDIGFDFKTNICHVTF